MPPQSTVPLRVLPAWQAELPPEELLELDEELDDELELDELLELEELLLLEELELDELELVEAIEHSFTPPAMRPPKVASAQAKLPLSVL